MDGANDLSAGQSFATPDSSGKALVPKNVNINQFYPQVAFSSPKERQPVKLGEFVETSPPRGTSPDAPLAITQGEEPVGKNNNNLEEDDSDGESKKDEEKQKEQNEQKDKAEGSKPKAEEESVFSTQVDENTLEAAKERQKLTSDFTESELNLIKGSIFEPENWRVTKQNLVMSEIIEKKIATHIKLATEQLEQKDYHNAITNFTKAILQKPSKEHLFECYVNRAEAYLQLADFQSCILNYKRACMLQPEDFASYSRLAFIYYFYGQTLFDQRLFPEALEAFSRAAEMRPEVVGYHTRSVSTNDRKRPSISGRRTRTYEDILYYRTIACLAALQRHGECLALVNKRLEVERDNADMYIMRARLHQLFRNVSREQLEKAEEEQKKCEEEKEKVSRESTIEKVAEAEERQRKGKEEKQLKKEEEKLKESVGDKVESEKKQKQKQEKSEEEKSKEKESTVDKVGGPEQKGEKREEEKSSESKIDQIEKAEKQEKNEEEKSKESKKDEMEESEKSSKESMTDKIEAEEPLKKIKAKKSLKGGKIDKERKKSKVKKSLKGSKKDEIQEEEPSKESKVEEILKETRRKSVSHFSMI